MGKFTVIPQNTFAGLQVDAGVILKRFNPANPVPPADEDIVCATTGGVNPVCKPTFSDFFEDVDNAPNNVKEGKHLDGWECTMTTTSLGTSPELIRLSLGCADIDSNNRYRIIPRMDLEQSDFRDLWWVGDRADGGLVAIRIKNALSTEGFSLQTTKKGKGTIGLSIMGHVSIDAQKEVPMEFYSMDPEEGSTFKVSQILTHVTSSFVDEYITEGTALSVTLTADTNYVLGNVVVTMAGEDVTSTAYNAGTVTIASVKGNVTIMATATAGV